MHEFFPTELVGPNTAEARLQAIKKYLNDRLDDDISQDALSNILTVKHPEFNLHTAEDYGFCGLCRQSGIPIHVDTRLIVSHEDAVLLPIASEQLVAMLKESWREPVRQPERN